MLGFQLIGPYPRWPYPSVATERNSSVDTFDRSKRSCRGSKLSRLGENTYTMLRFAEEPLNIEKTSRVNMGLERDTDFRYHGHS
jgi:hypothetical protein